ncbi:MAG TPA: HAMP domain-containing sensor histidine kinase [Tepidisphaeraceae bacterium]|nr:HAMP domain-containing sensor histidine kinase [Tepidisphaeraceae bacterium]
MERSRIRSAAIGYATAILAVAVANVLRSVLHSFGDSGISPLFFAAVIFSAWFGGLGPGIVATVLSGIATAWALIPQADTTAGFRDAVLRVLVFTVVAVLTSSLHAALKRAAQASQRARELAEEASAAKSRFLAMVSHELRAPLVPVSMVMDAIENDASLPTPVRRDAQMVRRSVEVELRLIDDLVDLSRIGNGKLNLKLERIDLHDPLAAAIEIARPDADDSQLDLLTELHATHSIVQGDPTRLQQIFWNLIRNAIKFTPPGGRVTIHTSNAPDGAMRVDVIDNGIGIAPEKLSRIFEAFEQASPDVAARFGGLGLGLAIAQGLAEAQGGAITAASAGLDRGTIFTVRLPTAQPDAIAPAGAANPQIPAARGK